MQNSLFHKIFNLKKGVAYTLFIFIFWGGFFSSCKQKEATIKIGFSQLAKDGWRQSQLKEMKRELAFHPEAKLLYKNAEKSSSKQIQQIKELLNQNIDVLIVSPYEAKPLTGIINKVYKKGIPVIFVDRKTNSSLYTTYIGSDNKKIGFIAGNYIAKILKGKGKVVDIQGLKGSTPALERHEGFYNALKKYPEIKIIKEIQGNWTGTNIPETLEKNKQTVKNADLIFAQNDVMAHAAFKTFKLWGLQNKTKFMGVDASPGPNLGLSWVSKGILTASVLYPTGGKEAIRAAIKTAKGISVNKRILLNTFVIDSTNVELMKLQTDKIISQQKDIKRQQNLIAQQIKTYKNQKNLLFLLLGISIIAIFLGTLVYLSFRKNKRILKSLRAKNKEILKQQNKIVAYSKQAKEATEAKLNFFTNISHEFRTPLTLIFGSIEEITETSSFKGALKEQLKMIKKNANRLYQMVNQLIDYRKIDVNKMNLHATEKNINTFLRDVISSFSGLAKKKNIDLRFRPDDTIPSLWFDSYMLDKVFFNLLSNAFKFTDDYGKISIYIKKETDHIIIEVSDNGAGIKKEDLHQIFNPFYQGKNNQSKGFGLGLPLAKKFMTLHHGKLIAVNKKGMGATFQVILPIGKAHLSEKEIREEPIILDKNYNQHLIEESVGLNGNEDFLEDEDNSLIMNDISLLIIEDNEDLLTYLKKRLKTKFDVTTARNGNQGLEKTFEIIPDLIICDIGIPGKDGLNITQLIKANIRTSHIPIILLTARGGEEQKIKGLETLADYYIVKPFKMHFLEAVIKGLIKNRLSLREHYSLDANIDTSNQSIGKIDRRFLSELNSYIDENIANKQLNVESVYKEMGMSRVQLYRKVKALLGCSINELILKKRLKKAKHLIKEKELTIAEIAYTVGFSSPSYFSSAFKKEFKITPSKYSSFH